MKTAEELARFGFEKLLDATKKFTDAPVPDDSAAAIVDGYISSRDRLKKSYHDNVDAIQRWIADRRAEFAADKPGLLAPLPPTTDVDGPAFRYSGFQFAEPVPGVDDASVERERQHYVEEKPKPGGLIGFRLSGQGEP
jgi:hypothetical protein